MQSDDKSTWEDRYYSTPDKQNNAHQEMDAVSSQTTHYSNVFVQKYPIGKGGFGHVFRVQNKYDDEDYAVKKILLSGNLNLKRIFREVKVWAKLKNNFLVQYKHSWVENGDWIIEDEGECKTLYNKRILYIQMELCKMTLREAINRINKELNQNYDNGMTIIGAYLASEIFGEILEGVNYLHIQSPPIIHRDLKLSNILITNGENGYFIKIGDFGLATIHSNGINDNRESDDEEINEAENFDINHYHTSKLGTFKYMAEEIKSGKYDTSADMYSLGIILCELFCIKSLDNFEKSSQNEKFNYNPIKQITLIQKLLQEWASKRPNCDKLLHEKYEWSVSFNEIKFTDNLCEICYNSWKSHFMNDESKMKSNISTVMLIKKCQIEVEKLNSQENESKGNNKEVFAMRIAVNVPSIVRESNIKDKNLCDKIFKYTLHGFNIFVNLPDLCSFIEKKLYKITSLNWHCFATSENEPIFVDRSINWFNTPYYAITFNNEFNACVMQIIIINIPNLIGKDITGFAEIKNTMNVEMSGESKKLSYKAIDEYINIDEMQLYISNGLKEKYKNQDWNCYISKNEFITFHEILQPPKYYIAFRIKEYCILIVNKKLESASCDAFKCEDKIFGKISINDKSAIEAALSPQIINSSLILKVIELNDHKTCIVRICMDLQYAKTDNNYKLFSYDIQLFWINNDQHEKQLEIPFGETFRERKRKYEMTEDEINAQIANLSENNVNENSSNSELLNWLRKCQKVLSSYHKINSKIGSLDLLKIASQNLDKRENFELKIALLRTTNYYIRRMILSDHESITSALIPIYVKLLESDNDNICFYAVEGFYFINGHCDQCQNMSLQNGFVTPLLELLKPNKSLALIVIIAEVIAQIAIPKFLQQIDIQVIKQLLPAVCKLIDHIDSGIIVNMISIIRNFFICDRRREYIEEIFASGISEKLVHLLISDNQVVQQDAIRTLGFMFKIYNGSKQLSGDALNFKIYLQFAEMLKSNHIDLRFSSIRVLQKISYKNESDVQQLIDAQLIPLLINIIKNDMNDMKIAVMLMISQIISASNEEQCSLVLSYGFINLLCNFISSSNYDECMKLCGVIGVLHDLTNCSKHRIKILYEIKKYGGLEKIEQLKHHDNQFLRTCIDNFIYNSNH